MTSGSIQEVFKRLVAVLDETMEGASADWSYFVDKSPDSGLFNSLISLSAEDASRAWAGTSIAAHAYHIIFTMSDAVACLEGDRAVRDWRESWQVSSVDAAAWTKMQENMRNGYKKLRNTIQSKASWESEAMGDAIGVVAHLAFHFGAIRQKLALRRIG